MKKILLATLLGFSLFSATSVSAHTGLTSSTPSVDEVITEELTEIELTYHGSIQPISSMTLTNEGETVSFEQLQVEDNVLKGSFSKPLENGTYTITWNVVGEDGHPITGDVPFSVQVKKEQEVAAPVLKEENTNEPIKQEQKEEEKEEQKSAAPIVILSTIFLLLAVVISTVVRRRKN